MIGSCVAHNSNMALWVNAQNTTSASNITGDPFLSRLVEVISLASSIVLCLLVPIMTNHFLSLTPNQLLEESKKLSSSQEEELKEKYENEKTLPQSTVSPASSVDESSPSSSEKSRDTITTFTDFNTPKTTESLRPTEVKSQSVSQSQANLFNRQIR